MKAALPALLLAPLLLSGCSLLQPKLKPFPDEKLEAWIEAQRELSLERLLRNVSPKGRVDKVFDTVHVAPDRWDGVKAAARAPEGRIRLEGGRLRQSILPKPGAVAAAPAGNPPEPDYFFHWVRDSAVVMYGLAELQAAGAQPEDAGVSTRIDEFVRFSRELQLAPSPEGLGEVRCNADGTPDFLKWSRPQYDGPALRALALMRYERLRRAPPPPELAEALRETIRTDLDFIAEHWRDPGFDLWEEYKGRDYYARSVQGAALAEGARRALAAKDPERAKTYADAAAMITDSLDEHWLPEKGHYGFALGPRVYWDGRTREKPGENLDSAVLLAALHGRRPEGRHSILDDRVLATATAAEDLFASIYTMNARRAPDEGVALGRYQGDEYFGGNAFVFITLGYAELHYRLARLLADRYGYSATERSRPFLERALRRAGRVRPLTAGRDVLAHSAERRALLTGLLLRGDDLLRAVRRVTPPSGALAEQIDQTSGEAASSRDLSWSQSSFLSAVEARREAMKVLLPQLR
ncbi:MAG: glycoside hydrolase family 15 protein [Elusimicrobiota bacterium]|jgi:glucoamylase